MPDGYTDCPKCEKKTLPVIEPASKATAAKCQNRECGAVIERERGVATQQ